MAKSNIEMPCIQTQALGSFLKPSIYIFSASEVLTSVHFNNIHQNALLYPVIAPVWVQ